MTKIFGSKRADRMIGKAGCRVPELRALTDC